MKEEKFEKFNKETGKSFNAVAANIFAPIYPVITSQIIDKFCITGGVCIDLGCGPGHLGIAMAKISSFKIYALDFSEDILDFARDNIAAENLSDRIEPVLGAVDALPFSDNFADLIISRGSVFFWANIEKAFEEIARVLKPGGRTYIGGGFGSAKLKEQITTEMRRKDPQWECRAKSKLGLDNDSKIPHILEKLNITAYEVVNDESGKWFVIMK